MKKILLVIDFINDIVHENGKLGTNFSPFLQKYAVLDHANQAISHARKQDILIAHVKVGFSRSYIECPQHSPIFGNAKKFSALMLDTWGTKFHEKIDVQIQDHILVKHRISSFYNTDLECVLRANQIEEIIITGVSTDMAVELAAREAHDRDYIVTVLKDACGAHSEEKHEASINNILRIAQVKTIDDWIRSSK
ncbi:isochorismatase family cysteine hydrolase [Fastidiosibacter lacustris]|uniref:isochorismatase family cysteine hydrolase n=1 Tax=Fastidiosibacter lacustris TaxID=2056695 RepID=UPI000E342263|nr:isochorismatase family cysteine hydrolase [Fastidiosibacter lacustris]